MEKNLERKSERIPTKQEVMGVILRYAESPTIVRELSDDKGLYLMETEIKGENSGETIQYVYVRKGTFPDHIESLKTMIYRVDYQDGKAVGGEDVTTFYG